MKKIILFVLICSITLTSCELNIKEKKGAMNLVVVALDYENTNVASLYGTLNDGVEIEKALRTNASKTNKEFHSYKFYQKGFDNDRETVENESYPSVSNILSAFDQLSISSHENDITIFYFSGHGAKEDGSILCGTTDYLKGETLIDLNTINPDYLIKPIVIKQKMSKIKGEKLIIVDACYSGFFYVDDNNTVDATQENRNILKTFFEDSNKITNDIFILCATESTNYSHEPSYLLNSHPHGYFSAALLEGLGWCYGEKGLINNTTVPSLIDEDDVQGILAEGFPPGAKGNVLSVDSLYTYIKENQNIPLLKVSEKRVHQHPRVTSGRKDLILFKY